MQPTELYQFRQGANSWDFTSGAEPVTYQSKVYTPAPIVRGAVSQSPEVEKNAITLDFPRTNAFALQFLGVTPEFVTTVTILRGEYGGTDFDSYWKGRVASGKANNEQITLACESVFSSIKRPGLRARYQRQCRHALYTRNCGVLQDSHRHEAKVIAVSRGVEIKYTGAAQPDGFFVAGIAKIGGAVRFISAHSESSITVTRPFKEDIKGMDIYLYPGCDHLKATCKDKFDNLVNFGGFPFIPTKNPFNSGSIA